MTNIDDVFKFLHFLILGMLAFFQEFFQGDKIYCYANFFRCANFSIVFGPNFREGEVSEGGLPQRMPPCGRKPLCLDRLVLLVSNYIENAQSRILEIFGNKLKLNHKLQASKDVSCQFGASSLSSMSTLTASASLSSVKAFLAEEQPNIQQRSYKAVSLQLN